MKKVKVNEELALLKIISIVSAFALVIVGIWIYLMYTSFQQLENFTDTTLDRYQADRVEMALARDYVENMLTSSTTEITHESRSGNTFYFQGGEESGAFMFIIEQTAPGQFEVINGISSLQVSTTTNAN